MKSEEAEEGEIQRAIGYHTSASVSAVNSSAPTDSGSPFVYRFGSFEVHLASHQLLKAGRVIHLQEQPLRLLMLLLERPGELCAREELRKRLWSNETFVEFDDGLNTAIQKIRQVLGDEARNPRFVETVPRQGYRFIAPVHVDPSSIWLLDEKKVPVEEARPVEVVPVPAVPAPIIAEPPAAIPSKPWPPILRRVLGCLAILVAGLCGGWWISRNTMPVPSPAVLRLTIAPPAGMELRHGIRGGSAISPDGTTAVFAATRDAKHQLWLRRLDSQEIRPLAGTDGGVLPFWSPDGKSIGFQSAGKIRRLDLASGTVFDLATATRPTRGSWTGNGTILFATGSGGPIMRVSADGGNASPVTSDSWGGALWPYAIPGSGRFLFYHNGSRRIQLGVIPDSRNREKDPPPPPAAILASESGGVFAPAYNGHAPQLLWLKGSTLLSQDFDPERGTLSGDIHAVAEEVGTADRGRIMDLTLSSNGVLLYGAGNSLHSRLGWFRRDGTLIEHVGEASVISSARLSMDGKRALVERGNPRNIWIYDFERSLQTRVTFEPEWSGWPVWSPDSSDIAYSGERDGQIGLYRRSVRGGLPESKLTGGGFNDFLYDWSPNGSTLIYCEVNPRTKLDLWMLPLNGDGKPRPFLNSAFNEDAAQFSPDGRWVVYVSDESGRNEIYVTRFPSAEGKWQISTDGGSLPRWTASGEIFYENGSGQIVLVKAKPGSRGFEWSAPRPLFANTSPGRAFSVAPQGDRILMIVPAANRSPNELTVVVHWHSMLHR
jgi:eukaryotic-like serine/threonine-protein kinase